MFKQYFYNVYTKLNCIRNFNHEIHTDVAEMWFIVANNIGCISCSTKCGDQALEACKDRVKAVRNALSQSFKSE